MSAGIAVVRRRLSELAYVTRTWFEWDVSIDGHTKTLVVEVAFDTDPSSAEFSPVALDEIEASVQDALIKHTTMTVHRVRVVPFGERPR